MQETSHAQRQLQKYFLMSVMFDLFCKIDQPLYMYKYYTVLRNVGHYDRMKSFMNGWLGSGRNEL